MKNKRICISLIMLIISMISCFVVLRENNIVSAYAADNQQDCYYLLGQDGKPYKANVAVGKASGAGSFIVGTEDIVLTATANENFQIKWWQIIYEEQGNRSEFVDTSELKSGLKEIILTAKDGTPVKATIEFVLKDEIYQSSIFSLKYVFEHITIRPVFDHVYYSADVTELHGISAPLNHVNIGSDVLYYKESATNDDVTEYSNAYIKKEDKYFYYGTLFSKDGKYYTIHKTLNDAAENECIDYTIGAFRFNDEVKVNVAVNIKEDIHESKNIDLTNVVVLADSSITLTKNTSKDELENSYSLTKDNFLRTVEFNLDFNIQQNKNRQNVVDITYHNLYVVDLKIIIDDSDAHSETSDVFGSVDEQSNIILGNVSIYNFYSKTNANNLQFLVKNIQDNNAKSFRIASSQSISKTIDGKNYHYYDFVSLDGLSSLTQNYSNPSDNFTVTLKYSSVKYQISFVCVEYIKNADETVELSVINGNVLDPIQKKRGENVSLSLTDAETINNTAYKFVGYADDLTGNITDDYTYEVDFAKPSSTTIYMCFEKITYSIRFTNYNSVNIRGGFPLNSVTFNVTNAAETKTQTLNQADLVGDGSLTSVVLSQKIKLDGSINISQVVNAGFNILGYSTKNDDNITTADLFKDNNFSLTAAFIEENSIESEIVIYVYEEVIKYSLVYYTELMHDNKLDSDVIMANISVECSDAVVEQYDILDQLISSANNNLGAEVVKIIVKNLKLGDEVKLLSSGKTTSVEEDTYTYIFNWFTEDDKSTLSFSKDGGVVSHTEVISRSREIKVVYSNPNSKILISIEEEFATNEKFSFDLKLFWNGEELSSILADGYMFEDKDLKQGDEVTIVISELSFGYLFTGYTLVQENYFEDEFTNNGLSYSFVHKTANEIDTLILDFERIEYQFVFNQYGAGLSGTPVTIDGKEYAVLDVDNREVTIQKPEGYYVSSVQFGNVLDETLAYLFENNDYRQNGNIVNYFFNINRDDFVNVVTNYGVLNNENVSVVTVRIDYLIFTYQVQVNYGITNPKGNDFDDGVTFPTVQLKYVYNGQTRFAATDPYAQNAIVRFVEIPYSSQATIQLTSEAAAGFSLSGWKDENGYAITNYDNSLFDLKIVRLTEDKTFKYFITYNAYDLNVLYKSSEGNPVVFINRVEATGDVKQITLFDRLDIVANASRNVGYVFDKFTYNTPVYTPYVYSQETWELKYSTLYILNGDKYQLNTEPEYDQNTTYYVYTTQTVECAAETFEDESFLVSDYALDPGGKSLTIYVNYKLLDLSIENTLSEIAKYDNWTLKGRGIGDSRISFDLNEMALISMVAKDGLGVERDIFDDSFVNYYDTLTVVVKINKNAKNIDDSEYDLSNGLELNRVFILGRMIGFTETQKGEYSFSFNVGNYLPATDTIINIAYELKVATRKIKVTTIITQSSTFYNNIQFFVNARKFGFDDMIAVSENNNKYFQHEVQFLAKASVYSSFTNDSYKTNYIISGVKIYSSGVIIPSADYETYGIKLNSDNTVEARLMHDLTVEFIVQPKISFNGGPVYTKTFECDNLGNAISQQLSVGSTSSFDIQIAKDLVKSINIKYISTKPNSIYTNSVINAGRYNVLLTFVDTADVDWLDEIEIAEQIVLVIQAKEIYLSYNAETIEAVKKTYDGTSNYDVSTVYKYLQWTDNKSLHINYSEIMIAPNNNLAIENANCYISSAGKDAAVKNANENIYYNLYIYNVKLAQTEYNLNFSLKNADLIIYNYIQITRREIKLKNISVYNKVYDGTDSAELISVQNISLENTIVGDDITINTSKLNPKFNSSSVGTGKKVLIDAANALTGVDVVNYYVNEIETKGLTIYPYSLSVVINGIGKIEVINKRGMTDKSKVDLIPLNANLRANIIYPDSHQYVALYGQIRNHVKGNNEFVIGYKLAFVIDGQETALDSDLYVSIPGVKNLTGVYFLSGESSGSVNFEHENGSLLIDLNDIGGDLNHIFLTRTKILLKAWQIILIVVGCLLIIGLIVLILLIIRKRKVDRDSVHEKI